MGLVHVKHGTTYGETYHVEFPHSEVMFHQKPQDVAVPEGSVKLLLSQEEFALSHCFLGISRVDSREEQKDTMTGLGRAFGLSCGAQGRGFDCAVLPRRP